MVEYEGTVAQPFSAVKRTFSPRPADCGDGLKVRPTGENAGATDSVMDILSRVMDPEIPTLSVLDLGMITSVAVHDSNVNVRLLPTFVACPATTYIKSNIAEALMRAGFESVQVDLETAMSWSSDRITERGRTLLTEFGLGAPVQIEGTLDFEQIEHVDCPHCGSANTELRSMFGSTLCRSIHYCLDCTQGFERFKPL